MMKLAIFDFEGTLVDFQWRLREALEAVYPRLARAVAEAGLSQETIAGADYCRLYNYLQRAISDLGLRLETMASVDEVFDRFDADAATRWQLYPEVYDLLAFLKAEGWGLALDSNVGRRALNEMFARFDLDRYFDVTVTRNDVALLKPAPAGIEKILQGYRRRNLEPGFTLLIGDSVTDIETARNAGIKVAVRTEGEDRTARLKAHAPDYLVSDLGELQGRLSNL